MDENLLSDYLLRHIDAEPNELKVIARNAQVRLLHGDMISGHLQGRLLKMITHMINPSQILELGTFIGYSALCFAEALGSDGVVHTIEIDDELEDVIVENLSRSPFGNKVKLHIGDAMSIINKFEDNSFQLVFVDADKRLYWDYFEAVLPKLSSGGVIIADNTLWHGKVIEPVKSNDWQTKAIIEFNEKLAADQRVEKVILPMRDGITLIRKK